MTFIELPDQTIPQKPCPCYRRLYLVIVPV